MHLLLVKPPRAMLSITEDLTWMGHSGHPFVQPDPTLARVKFEGTLGCSGLGAFQHSTFPICTRNEMTLRPQSKRQEKEGWEGQYHPGQGHNTEAITNRPFSNLFLKTFSDGLGHSRPSIPASYNHYQ